MKLHPLIRSDSTPKRQSLSCSIPLKLLLELQPETLVQGHLFEQHDTERSKLLMQTLDNLNRQYWSQDGTVCFGGGEEGLGHEAGEAIA